MANTQNSNTFYIDTVYSSSADELIGKNIKVITVVYTTSNATNNLVLADVTTGAVKLSLKATASGASQIFNFFDNPIVFPNGIHPTTVTACVATVVYQVTGS